MEKTRNSEALESFTRYCQQNPDQRFWQALRNWSRFDRIEGISIWFRGDERKEVRENTWDIEGLLGTEESVQNR